MTDLTAYGIYTSAGAIVCLDLEGLNRAIDEDRIKIRVANQVSRNKKSFQTLRVFTGSEDLNDAGVPAARRFYIGLPKGVRTEYFDAEHPKLIWKAAAGNTDEENPLLAFEEQYSAFIEKHIKPRVAEFYQKDDEQRVKFQNFTFTHARLSKTEEGGRGIPMGFPKAFTTTHRTRLQEAKGCHILMGISYFYNIVDEEKATVVFGSNVEVGRFPFQVTIKAGGKRPRGAGSNHSESADGGAVAKAPATSS